MATKKTAKAAGAGTTAESTGNVQGECRTPSPGGNEE